MIRNGRSTQPVRRARNGRARQQHAHIKVSYQYIYARSSSGSSVCCSAVSGVHVVVVDSAAQRDICLDLSNRRCPQAPLRSGAFNIRRRPVPLVYTPTLRNRIQLLRSFSSSRHKDEN